MKRVISSLLICFTLLTAGCSQVSTQKYSEVSRVRSFASESELSSASDLVVIGTVTKQSSVKAKDFVDDLLISTISLERDLKGKADAKMNVRQFQVQIDGEKSTDLKVGKSYLLYLTLTGLQGDAADDYYVTGVDSGIYEQVLSATAEKKYTRVAHLQGDKLPESLTESEVSK